MILCRFSEPLLRIAMSLTLPQLENIAHLARLALDTAELNAYQHSLSAIVDFVGQLNAVDTTQVEPLAHPLHGLTQRLRPDEITSGDEHARYQRNAPQVAAQLYLVPKVIE
jgi:aspartyl-tRNA(Asn)/glutamyl-tRNA(Gln) amidotransferase subunit C